VLSTNHDLLSSVEATELWHRTLKAGCARDISGRSEFSAEALPLFALLFRDQMLDALLAEVERMSNTPLPPRSALSG
jgi:hypothetical protein